MLKKEWQALFKNKILLLVMVALIVIPTIYSGLFLGSMWDPYGNVDSLPVAVVNRDKSAVYQEKTMEIGNNLVDNLKENQSLDFHFVDMDEAEQGLTDGKYYMVITIPEDFSANAVTVLDKNPKKMELRYETNPGTNYIASKMSETALTKIKDAVAEEVTKTYTETMFEQILTAGEGMQNAADGAGTLEEGISKLSEGNETISENLEVLANSTLTLKSGTDTLNVGLAQYVQGVSTVAQGAAQLNSGVNSYTDGVSQAAQGASELNANSNTLNAGVQQISSGVSALSDGSTSLTAGIQTMSSTIDGQLSSVSPETITALTQGLEQYRTGIHDLAAGISGISVPDTSSIESEASGLAANLGDAGTYAGTAAAYAQNASAALQAIDLTSVDTSDPETAAAALANAQAVINSAVGAVNEAAGQASAAVGSVQAAGGNAGNIQSALSGLSGAGDALSSGAAAVAQLEANADTVLGGASSAVSQLYGGLQSVSAALNNQILPGAEALQGGISQVQSGVDENLTNGVSAYTAGVSSLKSGLDMLESNSPTLSQGASQLYDGAIQLTANNDTILSGSSQLSDGASQLSDGAIQLAAGSQTLGNGLFDAKNGTRTLKEGLSDGAEQVNTLSATEDTYAMFAAPVQAEESQKTHVENNGHAMAPYMMSVGLWVGCIAFCIVYPLSKYDGKLKSGLSWWVSKASVAYTLAIAMAIAMVGLLHVFDGFSPAEMGKTVAFACLASVAFMSVIYFFEVCFGKIGSFLMLIFMVVQLAGSAGTYPVELSPAFVGKIHKWLPFTYTVNAFRSTIAGGQSIRTSVVVLILIAVVFTALTIALFIKRAENIKQDKKGLSDFLEANGLG